MICNFPLYHHIGQKHDPNESCFISARCVHSNTFFKQNDRIICLSLPFVVVPLLGLPFCCSVSSVSKAAGQYRERHGTHLGLVCPMHSGWSSRSSLPTHLCVVCFLFHLFSLCLQYKTYSIRSFVCICFRLTSCVFQSRAPIGMTVFVSCLPKLLHMTPTKILHILTGKPEACCKLSVLREVYDSAVFELDQQ